MNWNKYKKIFTCVIIMFFISVIVTNVYANINDDYYKNNLGAFKVSDSKEQLWKKIVASVLLDALGSLVYALASLGEWLLGVMFQAATGGSPENNIFPWADAIVFNAIPFLDVNFLNPYPGGGTVVELLDTVLKSVYGTIFGIAISFFSVSVFIMGIKLAISTVASEKARYKQAIWDWLLGLVLLFTMHIFISFVFYLNEKFVEEASKIASETLSSEHAQEVIKLTTTISKEDYDKAVKNFIDAMEKVSIKDVLTLGGARIFDGIDGSKLPELDESKEILRDNPEITVNLLQNEAFRNYVFGEGKWYTLDLSSDGAFWSWSRGDKDLIRLAAYYVQTVIGENDKLTMDDCEEAYEELTSNDDRTEQEEALLGLMDAIIDTHSIYVKGEGAKNATSLIANLAQYFKTTTWTFGKNSWKTDKVVIQNAIMYAILVVQSFMFLIAYVKRLFYVIILAMMAPAVVVYDFFNKSMS